MAKSEYDTTCKRLDSLAIRVLGLLQDILQEREYLNNFLKNGYVNIAKSRYLMGSQNVGILQINESKMLALKRVSSELSIVDGVEFENFSLTDVRAAKIENNKQNSLRHRQLEKEGDKLVDGMNNCTISDDKSSGSEKKCERANENQCIEKLKYQNPLNWFGVLVPECLRTSQKNFEESVLASIKIVSLQKELQAVCKQFKELLADKKAMARENTEASMQA